MAYENPTADDLQSAFPKFADVADVTVEFWLTRARRAVDESWCEDDYAMGQMLMASHLMTLQGLGSGTEAELAAQGLSDFKSVRSGSFSFTKAEGEASQAASGELASTSYGRQFIALARANRGGPRITPTGTVPYNYWPFPEGE